MGINLSNINGDGNFVSQGSNNKSNKSKPSSQGTLWGIVIGLLGVLVAVIVGWNEILSLFNSFLK